VTEPVAPTADTVTPARSRSTETTIRSDRSPTRLTAPSRSSTPGAVSRWATARTASPPSSTNAVSSTNARASAASGSKAPVAAALDRKESACVTISAGRVRTLRPPTRGLPSR
jgi:hypothetical protein